MNSIVALDIETTGLDPKSDSIIEIGAVRFNGRRIEGEYNTLIKPNQPIPEAITILTGINNSMVQNAPTILSVIHEFSDFIGEVPVVGHNIQFDLSFLKPLGVLKYNDVIDTYDLASVLLPTASRYNLGSLAKEFGIMPKGSPHRATVDAYLTHALFVMLYEKAMHLPVEMINEIVRLCESFDWGGSWVFNDIIHNHQTDISHVNCQVFKSASLYKSNELEVQKPIIPINPPTVIDVEEISSLLDYNGSFSKYFSNYECRPEQIEMIRAIANALNNSQHLMVEAGTGTGKSFAYLIPAAIWSTTNNARVVISTNTINLQDQLINKDIPDLKIALGMEVRTTVLKGRSNYLCPRRMENLQKRMPETVEEIRVLAKLLVWLYEGGCGDRSEINLNGPIEKEVWFRLSADNEGCRVDECLDRMGGLCPFYKARQSAQSAHIIIVNHALLLADMATGNRVLPDFEYVIIDEAHHLESATTNALSRTITRGNINRLIRELGGSSSGALGHLLYINKNNLRPSEYAALEDIIRRATDFAFRFEQNVLDFFSSIEQYLEDQREGKSVGSYGQQVRITPSSRTQPGWTDIEIKWDPTNANLSLLINILSQIHHSFNQIDEEMSEELCDAIDNHANILHRFQEVQSELNSFISEPDPSMIYWIEINTQQYLSLHIAPLQIGSMMEQYLWHEKTSVIITSATLTANQEFDYIRSRLYADEADELALGSPFDYESSALLYLVNNIPEPSDAGRYQKAVEQAIIQVSKASGGRLLALFTSYAQLKRTSQSIASHLAKFDIQVYEQGEGASANALLETFRYTDRAVLLGTRAFWEGVDIPGEALSVLVIVKIPFDVPSDPIIAARAETFDDPFSEYSLPEAILRFRQGFGRLIRTQTDRGAVVILDRRILSKRYGKIFIDSLPKCTLHIGELNDLANTISRWLN